MVTAGFEDQQVIINKATHPSEQLNIDDGSPKRNPAPINMNL
jgi:hypothetical protein